MKLFHTFILSILILLLSNNVVDASSRKGVLKGPISGEVLQVLDGDTMAVSVNVWLGQNVITKLRIDGIDTPEMKGKCDSEIMRAKEAREEIISLIKNNKIEVYDIRNGKYAGRVLAKVKTIEGIDLGKHMIEKGFARPYKGKKRKGWCA